MEFLGFCDEYQEQLVSLEDERVILRQKKKEKFMI
jgi:hypothetical protein